MSRWSSIVVLFCLGALIAETLAAPTDEPIIVRSKRQQCRCVKNPNGGLTCSCAKGPANGSAASPSQIGTGAQYDMPQSTEIANQLTQMSQQSTGLGTARCGCIQIVFQGAPQYNCQCGDQNGNPLPTSTTMAPTTPSTTTTTTTTPAPTTSTTTAPTTQLPVSYPNSQGNGACNCIMISITSPQTAQYQCQCAQPQQQQQQAQYAETYDYTQTYTVPPTTTTTQAPTTTSTTTMAPATSTTSQQMYADSSSATQYPLTTTCVMYVNVPTSACSCLPQYDQCAQNVCCLKAKYRSYKKTEEQNPSTIDMLMNVLQTIKTKWE